MTDPSRISPMPVPNEVWINLTDRLPDFELKGIMSALHGNQEKLIRMLNAFREQLIAEAPVIESKIAKGDLAGTKKLLHTLTGVAGTLGAKEFHQACTALEKQLVSETYDDTALADWVRTSEKTIGTLSALLVDSLTLAPSGDRPTLQQVIAELNILLDNNSFIGDELLSQLKLLFPDGKQAEYTALIKHIYGTDYPNAQQILNTVMDFPIGKAASLDQGQRPIILVVDDCRTSQEMLVTMLSKDYQVKVASNGQRALVIAQCCHPDLVLLDINMPQMNGYEVCQKLLEIPPTNNIHVIFVTSAVDHMSQIHGLQLGAVDYITKPFIPETTLLRVRNQLLIKQCAIKLQTKVELGVMAIDALALSMLIINAKGTILHLNVSAERLLNKQIGGLTNNDGHLSTIHPVTKKQLELLIASATSFPAIGGAIFLDSEQNRQVFITPLPSASQFAKVWQSPLALVLIMESGINNSAMQILGSLYDFTPAELRLASALLEGKSPDQYAQETGVTVNTVRTQLKNMFQKTGTHRQSELVAVLSRVPPLHS